MTLSIIIPCYNVEKFVFRCLSSIPFHKDIELIVVNDGSTDNTEREILNFFLKKNINTHKYIAQDNQGLSAARNAGIKNATGDYISFVDSDDYVVSSEFSKIFECIDAYHADLTIFDVEHVDKNDRSLYFEGVASDDGYLDVQFVIKMFLKKTLSAYAWNKIYKRDIVLNNNCYFNTSLGYFEDSPFFANYLTHIKTVYYIHKTAYKYVQHQLSITHNLTLRHLECLLNGKNLVAGLFKENNFSNIFVFKTLLDCLVISLSINDRTYLYEINSSLKIVEYYEYKKYLSVKYKLIYFFHKINVLRFVLVTYSKIRNRSRSISNSFRLFLYKDLFKKNSRS
jgi:glycosyltransferase involved in cell wall biosynthesis